MEIQFYAVGSIKLMPKAAKQRYYAVKVGREGSKIYTTWEEAKPNVSRYPGAIHKAFHSLSQAEEWLSMPHQNHRTCHYNDGPRTDMSKPQLEPDSSSHHRDVPNVNNGTAVSSSATHLGSPSPAAAVPLTPAEIEIKLSPEQQQVFDMVKAGQSVFFTGAAGTGKSVLLREIIRWCRGDGNKKLAVTASTGIASVNIGGQTLHSWAGIGLGKEKAERLLGKILGQDKYRRMKERQERERNGLSPDPYMDEDEMNDKSPRVVKRWREAQVLIIDEISMIDGTLFDKLEFLGRALRKSQRPFGGIQLVLSGDFCQLPPVPDRDTRLHPVFCFDANAWENCVAKPVTLRKVFRQKEQAFVDILNDMRFGKLSDAAITTFRGLSRRVHYEDGLDPTELFPTRNQVENANTSKLERIESQAYRYPAIDTPGYDDQGARVPREKMERLLKDLVAPQDLTLKVGAQVMLIKNLVQGELVNGSIGRIVGFTTARDALSQGTRLGIADSNASNKSASQAQLLQELDGTSGASNPNFDFDAKGKGGPNDFVRECLKSGKSWPIVQFTSGREVLCVPAQFEVNNAEGMVQARRDQVPLILAWALSIHKSQGQTLERVRVDLGRIFEKGQAYVALSRATSIDRLEVLNFDPMKVMAHERVLEWMREHGGMPCVEVRDYPMDDIDEELAFWGDQF